MEEPPLAFTVWGNAKVETIIPTIVITTPRNINFLQSTLFQAQGLQDKKKDELKRGRRNVKETKRALFENEFQQIFSCFE
jgi:hypothetical protein